MGFLILFATAFVVAFGLDQWLKSLSITLVTPIVLYLIYVALEVYVLPFHQGGFPGWEFVVVFVAPVVFLGAGRGAFAARWYRRRKLTDEHAL